MGGYVHRIELVNFKSYGGTVCVGPFAAGFTSVIGPNGAGKSNLMDAISFVMGLQARQLRGTRLRDLVHQPQLQQEGATEAGERGLDEEEEEEENGSPAADGERGAARRRALRGAAGKRKRRGARQASDARDAAQRDTATVRLVYAHDNNRDDDDDEYGGGSSSTRETIFARTVSLSTSSSTYYIDGRAVTADEYVAVLQSINILVRARNFLVFQNEVEEIASKTPEQLTALFEEVSRSVELKDEYNRLKQEAESAEQNALFCFQKKKGVVAERKQYKEQQEEAERYRQLRAKLCEAKMQHRLFQLNHIEADLRERAGEVSEHQRQLEDMRARRKEAADAAEAAKRDLAAKRKGHAQVQRRLTQAQGAYDRQAPEEAAARAQVQRLTKRIASDERALERARERAEKAAQELRALEEALADLHRAVEAVQRDEASEAGERSSGMDSQRYDSLRQAAATRTASLREELAAAERNRSIAQSTCDSATQQVANLEQRVAEAQSEIEQLRQRGDALERRAQESLKAAENARAEREALARKGEERARQKAELERIIEETSDALRAAKAERTENAREQRFLEALDAMKRLFPGVRGRLADLCRPTQRKYREAVAVVLGKSMDAVVVDDERTAGECISYLKEQRAGSATFLPLNAIRAWPVEEAARRLGGTARLVLDVIEYEPSVLAAVQYAAGNALVCDTLDEARRLAYGGGGGGGGRRGGKRKVCTVDGTLIHKNGFITGGVGEDGGAGQQQQQQQQQGSSSSRWDQVELEALKRKREVATRDLAKLGNGAKEREREDELADATAAAEKRAGFLRSDAHATREKLSRSESALQATREHLAKAAEERDAAKQRLESAEQEAARVAEQIDAIEREVYGDVPRPDLKRMEALRERRLRLEAQRSKLTSRIEYEKARDCAKPVRDLTSKLERARTELEQARGAEQTKKAEAQRLEGEREELRQQLHALETTMAEADGTLKDTKRSERALVEEEGEKKKVIVAAEARVDELRMRRSEVLTHCRVDEVDVPLLSGTLAGLSQSSQGGDSEEAAELSGEGASAATATRSSRSSARRAGAAPEQPSGTAGDVSIDYTSLAAEYRNVSTAMQRDQVERRFAEMERSFAADLERLSPNLKAVERMDDVKRRLDALNTEFEEARAASTAASERFDAVRNERTRRFRACFDAVAGSIDAIYKRLTRSDAYPLGGTAYLSLEAQDEPYRKGVNFNAMPPTKRFRDMDQLSGGERSVAALALLFAVHDYRPSPFLVLDEIDAALDSRNVGRVSEYVRERCSGGSGGGDGDGRHHRMQSIVISLKDSFYERADALVGIYRDPDAGGATRALTFDLAQYDDMPAAHEQQQQQQQRQRDASLLQTSAPA